MTSLLGVLGVIGSAFGRQAFSLGPVSFLDTEVPSSLVWGGHQATSVMRRPGGGKTIILGGYYDEPLRWTGVFRGYNALARARMLETMARSGATYSFTGAGLSREVVISSFEAMYSENGAVIPYRIMCEVIPVTQTGLNGTKSALAGIIGQDAATALTTVTSMVSNTTSYVASAAGMLSGYAGEITPLANLLGSGGTLSNISATLSGVSTNAGALSSISSTSAISSVEQQLSATNVMLTSLVSTSGAELSSISANASSNLVSGPEALTSAVGHAGVLASSVQASAYLGRASANTAIATGVAVN